MPRPRTIKEIERRIEEVKKDESWEEIKAEHQRLLDVMGHVEEDDVLALAIVATGVWDHGA